MVDPLRLTGYLLPEKSGVDVDRDDHWSVSPPSISLDRGQSKPGNHQIPPEDYRPRDTTNNNKSIYLEVISTSR